MSHDDEDDDDDDDGDVKYTVRLGSSTSIIYFHYLKLGHWLTPS